MLVHAMRFLQCTYEGGYRGVTPDFHHLSVGVIDTETADRLLFDYPTWFKEITREEFDNLSDGRWDGQEVPFVTYTTPPIDLARKLAEEAATKRAETPEEIPMDPPIEDAAEIDDAIDTPSEDDVVLQSMIAQTIVDLAAVAREEAAEAPFEEAAEAPFEEAAEAPQEEKPKGRSRGR